MRLQSSLDKGSPLGLRDSSSRHAVGSVMTRASILSLCTTVLHDSWGRGLVPCIRIGLWGVSLEVHFAKSLRLTAELVPQQFRRDFKDSEMESTGTPQSSLLWM